MKIRLLAGFAAATMLLVPLTAEETAKKHRDGVMSKDMREAIEFERAKDRADARQARLEARHPSVHYDHSANRGEDQDHENRATDPGSRSPAKKD
jgi:hypothetical protein